MSIEDVMVDLETLSSDSDAVVVSIGAVGFSPEGVAVPFYGILDRSEQVTHGRSINPNTVDWWLKQDALARVVFEQQAFPVATILGQFATYLQQFGREVRLWGNGSDFDNVILGNLYRAYQMKQPWSHRNNRCFRTLKNLVTLDAGEGVERGGTHHNALDDAIYQAEMAVQFMKKGNLAWR